jgi:hypothetical protein
MSKWLIPALRVIVSSAGAARDASLASVSDNPAAPKAGIVLLRRFLFDARFTALPALAAYQRLLGHFAPLRVIPQRPRAARAALVDVARTYGVDPTTIGRLHSPFPESAAAA